MCTLDHVMSSLDRRVECYAFPVFSVISIMLCRISMLNVAKDSNNEVHVCKRNPLEQKPPTVLLTCFQLLALYHLGVAQTSPGPVHD